MREKRIKPLFSFETLCERNGVKLKKGKRKMKKHKYIIKPPQKIFGLKFDCPNCYCEFLADLDSVKLVNEIDIYYHYTKCPVCGAECTTDNTPETYKVGKDYY